MWPLIFRILYPSSVVYPCDSRLYLTFDDGPSPELTPKVLDVLKGAGVKATFFFQGEQMERYPELVKLVADEGHVIAFHGYRHLSGLFTSRSIYIENFIHKTGEGLGLVRPPYGRIRPDQYRELSRCGKKVVFWTYLIRDFKMQLDLEREKRRISELVNRDRGQVFVFHDGNSGIHTLNLLNYLLTVSGRRNRAFGVLTGESE
jgi:peptidoglycan-N-acetylglucosamine deacetylase